MARELWAVDDLGRRYRALAAQARAAAMAADAGDLTGSAALRAFGRRHPSPL